MCTWDTALPMRRRSRRRPLKANRTPRPWWLPRKTLSEVFPRCETNRPSALLIVMEQAEDVVVLEPLAALQEVELHGKGQPGDFPTQLLHQLDGGLHGAAGGQQVIDEHDTLAALNGVKMNLQAVGAVLHVVGDASHGSRQLARLAHGHKPGIEPIGQGRPKDESARLNAENEVDFARDVA